MQKVIIALVLVAIALVSASETKHRRYWPHHYNWDEESDIAWVPVAIWAGKAFGAGALGAAGKHAYDKFIRRDSEESDIAWVPAAIWAGKAFGAGVLGAAGKHAYDKFIRRKDMTESDFAWAALAAKLLKRKLPAKSILRDKTSRKTEIESDLSWLPIAYTLYKQFKKDSTESDHIKAIKRLINNKRTNKAILSSDIAWVPVAIWAGKAFGAGVLGAAGKHAYDKFIRRKDMTEADIAWVPAAIWAGKAFGAGVLGAAGKHAYDKFIRRKDATESDLPWIQTAAAAYKLLKQIKKDSAQSDNTCEQLVQIVRNQLKSGTQKSVEELLRQYGLPASVASLIKGGLPTALICSKRD